MLGVGARSKPPGKRHGSRAGLRPVDAVGALAILAAIASLAVSSTAPALARDAHRTRSLHVAATKARTRYVLGHSVHHRPIVAWLIGPRHARRSMLVVGSIAGDEPGGIAVTRLLARQAPVTGLSLWLIPDMNPDGAARGTRVNAHGVDLNRNFPFRWRHLDAPGSRYYSGPRPSSEPESRSVEAFIRRIRPGLAVWLHQPYGLIDVSQGPRWAERRLAHSLKLPLQRLPDYPGSAIGWNDHIVHASAFDVELPGNLGQAKIHLAARAIRSLARRFASGRTAH